MLDTGIPAKKGLSSVEAQPQLVKGLFQDLEQPRTTFTSLKTFLMTSEDS